MPYDEAKAGGFCPGGFWQGGFCPRGFCPEVYARGVFVRGVFVLIPCGGGLVGVGLVFGISVQGGLSAWVWGLPRLLSLGVDPNRNSLRRLLEDLWYLQEKLQVLYVCVNTLGIRKFPVTSGSEMDNNVKDGQPRRFGFPVVFTVIL